MYTYCDLNNADYNDHNGICYKWGFLILFSVHTFYLMINTPSALCAGLYDVMDISARYNVDLTLSIPNNSALPISTMPNYSSIMGIFAKK